ncbi:MAG: Ferrochelatase [Candidatus Moanabacter tarae]|uniref:Ferrochelatase n=1 Tax=Candidatus Moanibacter tarae TaxID=2200854 RepID=A0A2Z4AQY0_9BACT|nr:MAG: Ferrochelatase [Candidatus Moanabacter tarae]|tara:strand:- start:2872 stop:3894 length:1023 start_codon:yes stop_codon:yes gene_type:complete
MTSKAVILLNLGSPDSPTIKDVRRYLKEFLSDKRVVDLPLPFRLLVLYLKILPSRPKNTAEAYSKIWTETGSPLITMSKRQRELVQEQLDIPIALAMRYGRPSVQETIESLIAQGCKDLFVIPLYPQYAMSSYETASVQVSCVVNKLKPDLKVTTLPPFYRDPDYIEAIYNRISPSLSSEFDMLLLSFHGVPERHLHKTDPSNTYCLSFPGCCYQSHPAHATCYRHQCLHTAAALFQKTNLPKSKCSIAFQSRLGKKPWLTPYTDLELERLAHQGVKKLLVACPAFVSDCLETLEEIGIRGKDIFESAGGESLTLIPCLNDHPSWIRFLVNKIESWLDSG